MNGDALKEALRGLLAKGEKAKDMSMMKLAAKKGAQPSPDMCPECKVPLEAGGKCPKCGYAKPEEGMDSGSPDGDLASLLESGARE